MMKPFLVLVSLMAFGSMAAVLPETKETKLSYASNDLAFELLKSYKNDKNVFISPFSISTALSLVYLGAQGSTARAIRNVLKYDKYELSEKEVHEAYQSILSRIRQSTADYLLSSYNSALVQKDFNIEETYKEALKQFYSAEIENVDFASQGEQVKAKINAAVDRATRGKIKNFLGNAPSSDTKLFLVNAVYFLGNWLNPFNPEVTYERIFYNNGFQEKKIQMMSRDGAYKYTRSSELDASVVVLPYKGENSASMIVVLPNEKTGITQLENKIDQQSLDRAIESVQSRRIVLIVPKFSLSYSTNLVKSLENLGLGELFSNNADLAGISRSGLQVSSVVHKAVIDVNEKGSEAAGSTGIEIVPTSLPPVIDVNHPFMFFIRDDRSGMILFSGKVNQL